MGSRGSVIPFFIDQIRQGSDITVTDPNMTRFLLTLPDAVELVIFAFDNARPGDIFVQKAPACTVGVLAQALLELFEADNQMRVIGTRHGEKQHESLLSKEEMAIAEDLPGFYRVPAESRDLNYDMYFTEGDESVTVGTDYSSNNTKILEVEGVKEKLLELEFVQSALTEWKASR